MKYEISGLADPIPAGWSPRDVASMKTALRLAARGYGRTSPNPMVGALVVRRGRVLGRGYHRGPGLPHAEIAALQDARRSAPDLAGATLYVTLEPCCTAGRTPPCTSAILAAGIREVVVGAIDPNPRHAGRGLMELRRAGVVVRDGLLADTASELNAPFEHWITRDLPLVTLKLAMTLDGRIADRSGQSQWITGAPARQYTMRLRLGADAVLVGVNTVRADNPQLLPRHPGGSVAKAVKRIILDPRARTPLDAAVLNDGCQSHTIVVVGRDAPAARIRRLENKATVWRSPSFHNQLDLRWLLKQLGRLELTHLLVEGGGRTSAAFLEQGLVQRLALFFAPKVLDDRRALPAVAGRGARGLAELISLSRPSWRRLGKDLLLTARVA